LPKNVEIKDDNNELDTKISSFLNELGINVIKYNKKKEE